MSLLYLKPGLGGAQCPVINLNSFQLLRGRQTDDSTFANRARPRLDGLTSRTSRPSSTRLGTASISYTRTSQSHESHPTTSRPQPPSSSVPPAKRRRLGPTLSTASTSQQQVTETREAPQLDLESASVHSSALALDERLRTTEPRPGPAEQAVVDYWHSVDSNMDDLSNSSSASYANSWISWFLASKGNEYFCEVDEDYIIDRFNLTGLNAEVQGYSGALELITDTAADDDLNDEQRDQLETSARHLYGLIHARFIITSRGLSKMIEKYKKGDFGRCPRVLCYGQALLPLGLSDLPYQKAVKLYCPRCEDLYSPKSSRHGAIDGAYFGSTFAQMLFMVYPGMIPSKSVPGAGAGGQGQGGPQGGLASGAASKVERIRPRIFGFKVHEAARLQRWQERVRDKQIARLEEHERAGQMD